MIAKRSIPLLAGVLLAGCATVPPPEAARPATLPPQASEPATAVTAPSDAEVNATFEKIGASYIDIYTALNPVAATSLGVFSGQGYAEGVGMGAQIGVQLLGIGVVVAWTAAWTWGLLKLVGLVTVLRATAEEETTGLDTTQHNERGYDMQTL